MTRTNNKVEGQKTSIFGPKRDEVTGEWRKLHNEELNGVDSSPNIVRVIKSRGWARHVARMEERCIQGLVGKREGKRPLGRPRSRWEMILRWVFRKWDVGVWIGSSWLRIGTGVGHL